MTDRELIELAARAAGIELCIWGTKGEENIAIMPSGRPWNPLADDGDAFRLAVKLQLIVRCYANVVIVDGDGISVMESYSDDPYAATRRAITRAAAEIGKAMNQEQTNE